MTFIPFKADILDINKRKLTTAGRWFVILGIGAIVAAICLGIENGKDMGRLQTGIDNVNKKYDAHASSDSAIGLVFDPKTNKLILVDTQLLKNILAQPVEENPKLEMAYTPLPNPRFTNHGDSVWEFEIDLKTNSKQIATGIRDRNVLIFKRDGIFTQVGGTSKYSGTESTELGEEGTRLVYHGNFFRAPPDTIYDYIRINYTNQNGKNPNTYFKIFRVNAKNNDQLVPEVHQGEYKELKELLIKKKEW
jgi:hypothetical protein